MESINVSNRGKRWTEADSARLKTLYCADKWSLVPLAQEFKRTPCSIWSRLVQYNIIAEAEQVRGYDEYLDKYAESYAATPPLNRKKEQPLDELRDDIHSLQKDVQEVKSLLSHVLLLIETKSC